MRIFFTLLSGLTLLADSGYEVKWVGEMHKVMMMGEDQGIISLASLKDKPNLFALGPVEGLNGEITVLNGQPFIGLVRGGKPAVEKTFDVKAPLLVYAQVEKWTKIAIPSSVQTVEDLDKFVGRTAHPKSPLPFRVTGHLHELNLHIVNRQGRDARGKSAHDAIEVKIPLTHAEAELIGFWSDQHGGVFTHMGSNVHIHGVTKDGKLSGHVDSMKIASAELWVPLAK